MNPRLRVLVVDDERLSRISMVCQLKDAFYEAEACESASVALSALARANWDVVVTDLRMPGMSGLELLAEIRRQYPAVDVIVITAYGSVETAVDAMRAGAADFLTKPFGFSELDFRLKKIAELRAARSEVSSLRALIDHSCKCGLVGGSPAIVRVCERIRAFAGHDAPVLVTGETGTGKEMVARALHNESQRANKPFIAVGCGTIPRELAESELFGHEKGSFTGASQRRKGSFERADGGTLLLDDIDDLPLDLQVKLLRVLQEGTLTRVGGSEEIKVDVRVVATSKVDLEKAASAGKFRDDVFYRLRGLEIRLPPCGNAVTMCSYLRSSSCGQLRPKCTHSPRRSAPMPPGHLRPARGAATCASCDVRSKQPSSSARAAKSKLNICRNTSAASHARKLPTPSSRWIWTAASM